MLDWTFLQAASQSGADEHKLRQRHKSQQKHKSTNDAIMYCS